MSRAPALKEFVLDFGSRLAAHDWWTDAVFLEGARPLDVPGRRELTPRVYLRGPLDEGPPFQALTVSRSVSTSGSSCCSTT